LSTMATNPLDAALESKEKLAAQVKADDHALWNTWKQDPTPENLRPLMQRHEPIFRQKVRLWKAPNVNEAAFKADLKKVGDTMTADWVKSAGADGQAIVDAFRK